MHPYRDAPLRLACGFLLAWALVGGGVAAYDGSRSADVWLAMAVVLVVIPAAARRRRT